jgi:hypothetical protein
MLIVGYCFAIRSERRPCAEVHLNLAYRWSCRLGLDGRVPDHSTFSLNRNGRFRQSDALRHVFEAVVARCIAEGLVGSEGFALDASLIQTDANKQRSVPGHEWHVEDIPADAGQAVRDYIATSDDAAFGAATVVTPKFVSPSDPPARGPSSHRDGGRTTSLSNVDAPIGRPRSGATEAFSHRRHYGAAKPTPERTMSPMRPTKITLDVGAADREHSHRRHRRLNLQNRPRARAPLALLTVRMAPLRNTCNPEISQRSPLACVR